MGNKKNKSRKKAKAKTKKGGGRKPSKKNPNRSAPVSGISLSLEQQEAQKIPSIPDVIEEMQGLGPLDDFFKREDVSPYKKGLYIAALYAVPERFEPLARGSIERDKWILSLQLSVFKGLPEVEGFLSCQLYALYVFKSWRPHVSSKMIFDAFLNLLKATSTLTFEAQSGDQSPVDLHLWETLIREKGEFASQLMDRLYSSETEKVFSRIFLSSEDGSSSQETLPYLLCLMDSVEKYSTLGDGPYIRLISLLVEVGYSHAPSFAMQMITLFSEQLDNLNIRSEEDAKIRRLFHCVQHLLFRKMFEGQASLFYQLVCICCPQPLASHFLLIQLRFLMRSAEWIPTQQIGGFSRVPPPAPCQASLNLYPDHRRGKGSEKINSFASLASEVKEYLTTNRADLTQFPSMSLKLLIQDAIGYIIRCRRDLLTQAIPMDPRVLSRVFCFFLVPGGLNETVSWRTLQKNSLLPEEKGFLFKQLLETINTLSPSSSSSEARRLFSVMHVSSWFPVKEFVRYLLDQNRPNLVCELFQARDNHTSLLDQHGSGRKQYWFDRWKARRYLLQSMAKGTSGYRRWMFYPSYLEDDEARWLRCVMLRLDRFLDLYQCLSKAASASVFPLLLELFRVFSHQIGLLFFKWNEEPLPSEIKEQPLLKQAASDVWSTSSAQALLGDWKQTFLSLAWMHSPLLTADVRLLLLCYMNQLSQKVPNAQSESRSEGFSCFMAACVESQQAASQSKAP